MNTQDLLALFERRRLELGLSQAGLGARAVGRADSSLIQNMKRGKEPGIETVEAIATALGLEFYVGPPRDPSRKQSEVPVEIDGETFAYLPLYNAEVSAGHGASAGDEEVLERIAVHREWLARIGVKPENASLVKVRGDSMVPTLHSGDTVLIDQARADGAKNKVYALVDVSGDTKVKRVERPDRSTLILSSDNPAYPTELRRGPDLERVRIIGEVRWSGHTWR